MDRHRRHLPLRQLAATIRKGSGSAAKAASGRAIKVWDKREFRNLDNQVELGTRNIKVALRRLRRFAREGAADELDLDETIDGTARKGWLDIRMRPERHNAVKLLLFLDVGGSMDPHIKLCEELFSRGDLGVQESRILLLPQLPLRGGVEGQSPPLQRAHADLGRAPQISATTTSWCSSATPR